MTRNIILSLKKLGYPNSLHLSPRFQFLLDTYDKCIKDRQQHFDLEDFIEDACRLHYAMKYFDNVYVLENDAELRQSVKQMPSQKIVDKDSVEAPIVIGGLHSLESKLIPDVVDEYMFTDTFQKNAGRQVLIAPLSDAIENEVASFRTEEVFVKTVQSKQGIWVAPKANLLENLNEIMDWSYVRLKDGNARLLFQEKITMEYEYRCFVVDGEVVTSAGCIEEFTPLNNQARFDQQLVQKRNESEIFVDSMRQHTLLAFAQIVAREFAMETGTRNFVVDVALDDLGEPLVVEFNGLGASGLYACSPDHLFSALAATSDRSGVDNHDWSFPAATRRLIRES